MGMNKKELAEMESLRVELLRAKSFRLTDKVERDLPPPPFSRDGLTKGWDYNAHSLAANKHCSSSMYNGSGWEKTTSQQPRSLFSTELLALRAMRYHVEQEAMTRLAAVDALIAAAQVTP